MMQRMTSPFTNRVSVVIWSDVPSKVQTQLAVEGRFEVLWSIVANGAIRQQLAPKFNPQRLDFVCYFYKGEYAQDHLPDDLRDVLLEDLVEMHGLKVGDVVVNETRQHRKEDRERRATKDLYEEMLALRPGFEFDHIRKTTLIEDHIPLTCGDASSALRLSRVGDRLEVHLGGRIVGTGDEFATAFNEIVTVGSSRGDFPDVLMREGLEGLCAGSKRRLGFPARKAYTEDMLPPGVGPDAKVVFTIEVVGFAESGEKISGNGGTGSILDLQDASETGAQNPPEEL
jgi:hypothetical protein